MANTTERSTAWSLTINNPTESDHEAIATARQRGWKVTGQLEKGEGGTLHYQLMLRTPQCRFSTVKKHFDRGHIEIARNVDALAKYVSKVETRVGTLPTSEKYPSMSQLWQLIYQMHNTDDKDGWNIDNLPHYVQLFDMDHQRELLEDPLGWFDCQIRVLIEDGYHVESMAVNPQVRSCWKHYWPSILCRAAKADLISHDENTTNDALQEVHVPSLEEEDSPPSAHVPPPLGADLCPAESRHDH